MKLQNSEEIQQEESAVVPEADFGIDSALVLYKKTQQEIDVLISDMISPVKRTGKRKTSNERLIDLSTLENVIKDALFSFNPTSERFETNKAKALYESIAILLRSKEVIKNDMKAKLENNEVDVDNETKENILKRL